MGLEGLVAFVRSTDVACTDVQVQDLVLDSFFVYPGPAEPPAADSVEFIAIGGAADVYPTDASAAPDCSLR